MSTKTIAERIQELASTTPQTELLALINRYSKDIEHENAFEVVVKAIEMNNLETAKILAVVNMLTHYCWTVDPAPEFDTAIAKAQNGFSWVSYVDFTATSHRKGILRRLSNKNTLAEALISKNLIRLCYFVQCPIHTFSLMLAEFNDPEQLSETTYRIMIVKGLTRSDRHHRMKIMKECNKLTLEPCGPEKLSPPFYCLLLDKLYLLKYFKHLPGLGKYRPNFLIYAWTHNHRYLKHIQLFDKEELKTMLVEKHNDIYVADLLKKFKGKHLTAAFVSAFRELLTEGKLRDSKEVELPYLIRSNIGGKFIYQHSGIIIIGSIQGYADAEHFSGENGSHFIGHTAFTFEELPFEIFQLICDHLNSRAIFALISSSKSLQQFSTRFDQRYYEQLMKREFSMIYGSLETDQSETSVDWKHKFDIYSRREYGWHNCQDPVQIRITPPNEDCAFGSILAFDENWMIIGTKYNGTLLWNFKDQKLYHKEFISSKKPSSILNSPESEFPTIVSYLGLSEVAIVNFDEPISAIRKFKMQGWTTYLASVSPTRFLAGDMPTLYDVELSETIVVKQCNQISRASIAKYNKINQLTAVAFFEAHDGYHHYMCILDQNLEITHKVGPYKCVEEITWLNEFTYSTTEGNGKLKISDIRMPHGYVHKTNTDVVNNYKRISRTEHKHMPNQTGNFTNNLFLEIDAETKLACVWSMKDFTWSNVIVLPDDVKGERVFCNSRYAAVETTDNSICLLDFMSNK